MAYFRNNIQKQKAETITLGDGVNTYNTVYTIEKNQAFDSRNTSSDSYPSLSTRKGVQSAFSTITTPNGATIRNGTELHIIDGTSWKYWNGSSFTTIASGLTDTLTNFVEFRQQTTTWTIMFNGTEKKAYDGSNVVDITEADATKIICVDDNRLYTLKDAQIKCSALHDPFDFTTAFDSFPVPISGLEGTETAIVGYENMKIAFSDRTMHILLGDNIDNFQVQDPIKIGCVSHRSIAKSNGILYFLDYGKYMMFSGGFPKEMSKKVERYLNGINYNFKEKIVAGVQGRKIYLSIPYQSVSTGNNTITLEYDTELNNWYVIDKGYVNFFNIGEELYGVKQDGDIEQMNIGDHSGSWYHETGVISPTPIRPNKTLSDMWLELELPTGSSLAILYSETANGTPVVGGGYVSDFAPLYGFTAQDGERKTRVRVPTNILANKERYRLKFFGIGPAKIHFLEIYERIKRR